MSRIGKKPVPVPANVKVAIADRTVEIQGPKGTLRFTHRPEVAVAWRQEDRAIDCTVDPAGAGDRAVKAQWGSTRAILNNMVQGVTEGYQKQLHIEGVGWGAQVSGKTLDLTLGYASPVKLKIPEGLTVTANKQQVIIAGADKQRVGEFAAKVRSVRKPEPYNAKGIRYVGEQIRRKQGKQFGS